MPQNLIYKHINSHNTYLTGGNLLACGAVKILKYLLILHVANNFSTMIMVPLWAGCPSSDFNSQHSPTPIGYKVEIDALRDSLYFILESSTNHHAGLDVTA